CIPARAAIATGRYPSQCGAPTFITYLPPSEVTFATLLQRAGYHTAMIGKLHFGPTDVARGHDEEEINDLHGPHGRIAGATDASPSYLRFLRDAGFAEASELTRREGRFAARWLADVKYHLDHFIGDRGVAWLTDHRPTDKPWYLCLSFPGPHMPYDGLGTPQADLYDPSEIDLPRTRRADLADKPPHFAGQYETGHGSPGINPQTPPSERELRELRLSYYANVTLIDEQIGRVVAALKAAGQYDDTLIIFTSDHGDFMGDYGLVGKGQYLSEVLMRIPLLVKPPVAGFAVAGRAEAAFVNAVDIAPTCLAAAGAEIPPNMPADDLTAFWADPAGATRREDAYTEAAGLRGLRTDRWKLVHYLHRPYGELYDLAADPWERVNLWDDPSAAGARAELTRRLADRMIELGARSEVPWNRGAPEI
ncbi:hypothetical protein LCGC14_2372320, partial [marine sediment metagenome]